MFVIGENTLVSLDVLEKEFCCDLDTCRGCRPQSDRNVLLSAHDREDGRNTG